MKKILILIGLIITMNANAFFLLTAVPSRFDGDEIIVKVINKVFIKVSIFFIVTLYFLFIFKDS